MHFARTFSETHNTSTSPARTRGLAAAQTDPNVSALLKFFIFFSVEDGNWVHGQTPSVHFNMNGYVSLVLLERQRCEIADGARSAPPTRRVNSNRL